MRYTIFTSLAFAFSLTLAAQKHLKVSFSDGTVTYLSLAAAPEIRNEGEYYRVVSSDFDMTYSHDLLSSVEVVASAPTGITSQQVSSLSYEAKVLKVSAVPGTPVRVVTINGVIVHNSSVPAAASWEFDLSTLAKGVYVVLVGDKGYRVIN